MDTSPLLADLDRLLQLHQPPAGARVDRHEDRCDIEFRHGTARLVVSVFFDPRSYRVGKRAPASCSSDDARYAHVLSQMIKPFLRGLASLGIHVALDERVSALCAALDSREQWGLQASDLDALCFLHGFRLDVVAVGMHQRTGTRVSLVLGDTVYQLVRLSTGLLRPIGTAPGTPVNPVLSSLP